MRAHVGRVHVQVALHLGERVQVAVHVGPAGVLALLLGQLLVAHLLVHGAVLVRLFNLILEQHLVVSRLLARPRVLLLLLKLRLRLRVAHLLRALGLNLGDLFGPQFLEVVGHVTVRPQLAGRGAEVLSHDVAVVGGVEFVLVHPLLGLAPVRLAVPFGLSHALVLVRHCLHHRVLLQRRLVLQHAAHPGDRISLLRVRLLFRLVQGILSLVLALLLLAPVLLVLGLSSDTLVVEEVLAFKLAAPTGKLGRLLFGPIEALSGSFHFCIKLLV